MTQKELAERCGVSSQHMSFFEKGDRIPQTEVVHKMAFALGLPPKYFYGFDVELLRPEIPSFRSRRSMTSRLRDAALASGEIASEIISIDLNDRFVYPDFDIPDLSSHRPEDAADILRVRWGLGSGPILNMVHLLEAKGVELYWINEESSSVDAFSFWREQKPFVLLNSNKNSGERSRFDAAHELGHLVMHRYEESLENRETEVEANQFASAFLLPKVQYELEFPKRPTLNILFKLKERWRVSVHSMVYRGRELGIFSEWQSRSAFKKLSAAGMKTKEEKSFEPEESYFHQKVYEALLAKDISPEDYAEQLSLSNSCLTELMPFSKKVIPQSNEGKIIQLRRVV